MSTSVSGRDLVAGTKVTLRFDRGQLGANAGCNSMSGGYAVGPDGTLDVGQMATTEMACEADLMAQDQWLAAFLPGAAVSLDGTALTLAKDGVTLALVDQQATNLPLEGTVWTVDGLIASDAVSSVPQGVTATLVVRDGGVDVSTGCNSGHGSASVGDGAITFGTPAITAMLCNDDAMRVEAHVLRVLQGVQPYSIAGDSLTIGGGGKDGLTLRGGDAAATPAPGAS